MTPLLCAAALLLVSGTGALFPFLSARVRVRAAVLSALAASATGLPAVFRAFAGHDFGAVSFDWSLPVGAFSAALDPLSALFLMPLFILGPAAAVYGVRYMDAFTPERSAAAAGFLNILALCYIVGQLYIPGNPPVILVLHNSSLRAKPQGVVMIHDIHVIGQRKLFHVGGTIDGSRLFPCLVKGRKQHPR